MYEDPAKTPLRRRQRPPYACLSGSKSLQSKSVVGLVQVTDTDQLVRKRWVVGLTGRECRNLGIGSRVHTRKAGYPLRTFAGSRELLSGTYGAFQGEIPPVPVYIC